MGCLPVKPRIIIEKVTNLFCESQLHLAVGSIVSIYFDTIPNAFMFLANQPYKLKK